MNNADYELRSLMDKFENEYKKLEHDRLVSKEDDDFEAELNCELLQRQLRKTMAQLFQSMKAIGLLDEEEIEWGTLKHKYNTGV